MNLHKEARDIATEALAEAEGDFDTALDYIHEMVDGHEISIYYGKAIDFCATHDTTWGEDWLEDCGGISFPGDSFGNIACRVAFATLFVAAQNALYELDNKES